jgi:pilus assembly protein CpaF
VRVIPDITRRHMAVNIRKFVLQAHSLDELVALGTVTAQAARFLEAAVASGLNVLVSGGTQAGNPTIRQDTARSVRSCQPGTAFPVMAAWPHGQSGFR